MKSSHNVLKIESVSFFPDDTFGIPECKAQIQSVVELYCSVTGNLYCTIQIDSEGNSLSDREALRIAIENLINGHSHYNKSHLNVEVKSITSNKVHKLDILVPEPLKSIFSQVFDASNWKNEIKLIEKSMNAKYK